MKRILCAALVLGSVATCAFVSEANAAGLTAATTSKWYLDVSALALSRSTPGGGAFVSSIPGGAPFLSSSDLQFGMSPGIDATIGYHVFDNDSIEARFMYSKFDGTNNFVSPGHFIGVGFSGPGGTNFDSVFSTTFHSEELNWRHSFNDHVSVLIGVRALDIRDSLGTQLNATAAKGQYDAGNGLFGAQVGAEFSLLDHVSPFQISLSGKLGAYSNQSSAGIQEYLGASQTFFGSFESGNQNVTSFAADFGITAEYKFTDSLALTAGYQAIWANNLALASNAASSSKLSPSLLTTNVYRDDLWMHGVKVGLRLTF